MKALTKLTVATLAVAAIGAVAVHTIEAHVISPVSALHQEGTSDLKTMPTGRARWASLSARGSLPKGATGCDRRRHARPWPRPAHLPGLGKHPGGAHVVRRRTLVNARGGALDPDGSGITDGPNHVSACSERRHWHSP